MSKFKECYLAEFLYPCVTYVIRRLGLSISPEELYFMEGEDYTEGSTDLTVGDILVYISDDNDRWCDVILKFTDRGPVTTRQHQGKHFCVYEGKGFISDLTFYRDNDTPFLRQMPLSERKKLPKKVIRYSCLMRKNQD